MPTTTRHRALIGRLITEKNREPVYKAMMAVGYSKSYALQSTRAIKSKGFMELLEQELPDDMLVRVHKKLLTTKSIDHMVFPLSITDEEIEELVESVGGTLRKIIHGETAKHAYWWIASAKARGDALKLAYDLKGKLGSKEPPTPGNTYNTFIQQNNINPNTPDAKQLVDSTLDTLMQQTKRKVIDAQ